MVTLILAFSHDDSKMFSEQRYKTLAHYNTTEQILKHQNKS